MKLHITPIAGAAGDMFVSALAAAGAPEGPLTRLLEAAGSRLGRCRVQIDTRPDFDGAPARRLVVMLEPRGDHLHAEPARTHLSGILSEFTICGNYSSFAENALDRLIHAEALAHGNDDLADVHLHEAQDILIDLAGAAWAMQALNVDLASTTCSGPVPTGSGLIQTSHGPLNVPAPATENILKAAAIRWEHGPYDTEVLTPTGAAILAALKPTWIDFAGAPASAAWGQGHRALGRPNLLGICLKN